MIEHQHDAKHQHCIEHVQEYFVPQQVSCVTHDVLDNTEDASHEDESAGHVEHHQVFLPGQRVEVHSPGCGTVTLQALVKQPCHHDEEAEKSKLEEETDHNKFLARLHGAFTFGCLDPSATALNKERDDVARNENFCEPLLPDERMLFAVGQQDDTAQNDVDGGGEEGGCDKKEQRLHYEGTQFPLVEVRLGAADVAYKLNCRHV